MQVTSITFIELPHHKFCAKSLVRLLNVSPFFKLIFVMIKSYNINEELLPHLHAFTSVTWGQNCDIIHGVTTYSPVWCYNTKELFLDFLIMYETLMKNRFYTLIYKNLGNKYKVWNLVLFGKTPPVYSGMK